MKNLLILLLVIGSFTCLSVAQTPKPSPTPPKNDDDVVIINTTLIQIDVTVTDKKGQIVKDLKPEDFEVYENKEPQKITNFSFIQTDSKPKPTPTPVSNSKGNISVPIPPAQIKLENVKRTVALVVDDLSLSFESTAYVRRALKKFVDEQMQEGDLVAIIRTGAGIGALQQFTSDKRQLYAAIEKVKWNPSGGGGISAFAPIEQSFADFIKNANPNMTEEEYQAAKGREREGDNFRGEVFATGTLGALNYIIKGMKDLPGRKSVMLISEGFQILQTDRDGFSEVASQTNTILRNLIDIANRSSVVIYSMDARGLQTLGVNAADNTNGLDSNQINQQLDDRKTKLIETQASLKTIAEETGGFAVINNNDLSGGVQKMLNDQTGYYLIGYEPDEETFDAKTRRFNRLNIKVKNRPDLQVRYRSGFFGVTDAQEKKETVVAKLTPTQQIMNAISSPFGQNDISLTMNSLFGNNVKTGNYVLSFLHIKASDLVFKELPDGKYQAVFDIVALTFGDNGIIIDQFSNNFTIKVSKDGYKNALEKGFVYNFSLPIKKAGAYQMRVALRDAESEKVGSASQFVEIPNLKKGKLTISGMVLENLTEEDLQREAKNERIKSDVMNNTSLRKFKKGTILRYGFEVYNAKIESLSQKPNLKTQVRVFHEGKMILEGKIVDANLTTITPKISSASAISLGNVLKTGEYVLQIIIIDTLAKEKNQIATQFIQFEVIE